MTVTHDATIGREAGGDLTPGVSTPPEDILTREFAGSPADWWRELAPALAGRRQVRVYRPAGDGTGGGYEVVRALSGRIPAQPAALLLYNDAGQARSVALDFDPKGAGADRAEQDAADAAAWWSALGGRVVVDRSARGGWHVWVPLAVPAGVDELSPLVRALARHRWPSLDTSMVANVRAGCLTGPGSACRPDQGGGHRQLVTPFAAAVQAVRDRSHPELLRRAVAAAEAAYGPLPSAQSAVAGLPADVMHVTVEPRRRALVGVPAEVAVTGSWPTGRYASSSEAAYAVLTAAVRRGWSLAGVVAEIESGRWGGLAALYEARRATATRRGGWRTLLAYEWRRALSAASQNRLTWESITPTPDDPDHRGAGNPSDDQTHVRYWFATMLQNLDSLCSPRHQVTLRVVLTAVAWLAWRDRTRYPSHGLRSLSLATGGMLDPDTIGDALLHLRTLPDQVCPMVLLERHDGHRGDRYELVLPAGLPAGDVDQIDEPRPIPAVWGARPGGERQAVLGPAAWWLYRHLDTVGPAGATAAALAAASGLSRSAVYRHLQLLAEHDLAVGTTRTRADDPASTWTTGSLSPVAAGQRLDADAWYQDLIDQYRAERRVWRAWRAEQAELRAAQAHAAEEADHTVPDDPDADLWRELLDTADLDALDPGPPAFDQEPPALACTDDDALALLTQTLGAAVVAAPAPVAASRWIGAAANPRQAAQIAAISASITRRRTRPTG